MVGDSTAEELRQVNPHQLHWDVKVNQRQAEARLFQTVKT